jgi:hypothetical protein
MVIMARPVVRRHDPRRDPRRAGGPGGDPGAATIEPPKPISPDPSPLDRLLDALGTAPEEYLSVCRQEPGGEFTSAVVPARQASGLVARFADRADMWFGVCPIRPVTRGRGTAADVTRLPALWADLDIGKLPDETACWAVIADLAAILGQPPTAVVRSGHGLQPYWRLTASPNDPAGTLNRWGAMVKDTARAHGGTADSVFDLPRVMRVPGSMNRKSVPVPTELIVTGGDPVDLSLVKFPETAQATTRQAETGEQVVHLPATWTWGEETCPYVRQMVEGWSDDVPDCGRHPWLFNQAVRLACAHRAGCITENDYDKAADALEQRFNTLVRDGIGGDPREPHAGGSGEVAEALRDGIALAAKKTDVELDKELGEHTHPMDPRDLVWGVSGTVPLNGAAQSNAPLRSSTVPRRERVGRLSGLVRMILEAAQSVTAAGQRIVPGNRNHMLSWAAYTGTRAGIDENVLTDALLAAAIEVGLPHAASLATIKSGIAGVRS